MPMESPIRAEARRMYADAVAAKGSAWSNTANSIRSGYENNFIVFGIDATEAALRGSRHEDDDPQDQRA